MSGRNKRTRPEDGSTPDPNTQPKKKARKENNLFAILHDELIIDILISVPVEQLATIAVVCKRWNAQLIKQEYWKKKTLITWKTSLSDLDRDNSGSLRIDRTKLFVPTLRVSVTNQEMIDWRRYFKIRSILVHLRVAIKGTSIKAVDLAHLERPPKEKKEEPELTIDNVMRPYQKLTSNYFFRVSVQGDLSLLQKFFELGVESAPVLKGNNQHLMTIAKNLLDCAKHKDFSAKHRDFIGEYALYYASKYFEVCQIFANDHAMHGKLFAKACKVFATHGREGSTGVRLFNLLVQHMGNLALLSNEDEERHEATFFQFRHSKTEKPIIRCLFIENHWKCCTKKYDEALVDLMVKTYNSSNDPKLQAISLALCDVSQTISNQLRPTLIKLACMATKHSDRKVAFAGYVLLWKQATALDDVELKCEVFQIALEAMDNYPQSILFLINIITRIAGGNADFISDAMLAELNAKILKYFNSRLWIFVDADNVKSNVFFEMWRLGHLFKERFEKYLPEYEKALIQMAMEIGQQDEDEDIPVHIVLFSEQILHQYMQLLIACKGDASIESAEEFVSKILANKQQYNVREPYFCALFGEQLFSLFKEEPEELSRITRKMVKIFDKRLLAWGAKELMIESEKDEFMYVPWSDKQFKAMQQTKECIDDCNEEVTFISHYFNSPPRKLVMAETAEDLYLIKACKMDVLSYSAYTTVKGFNEMMTSVCKTLLDNHEVIPEGSIQPVLHLMLALYRVSAEKKQYLQVVVDLFERLKDNLAPFHRDYYIAIIIQELLREPQTYPLNIHSKLVEFYFESGHLSFHVAGWLFKFAMVWDSEAISCYYYSSASTFIKKLIERCPRVARHAVKEADLDCLFEEKDFEEDRVKTDDRMITVALLTYYFGAKCLDDQHKGFKYGYSILSTDDYVEKALKYLANKKNGKPSERLILARFVVIKTLEEWGPYESLCLFKAIYLPEKKVNKIMKIVRFDKFTTGSSELDAEVKAWTSLFDFEKISIF